MAETLPGLNLGVREVFRILVPGVYAVAILRWLAPQSGVARFAGEGFQRELIAAFFIGLVGYGLQVHEKWFPFNLSFERWRIELNNALGGGRDRVDEYKYFLETQDPEIKDRVHYFSSFYYMLIEMSLFSAIAALGLLVETLNDLRCLSKLTISLFFFAIGVQMLTLYFPKRSERNRMLDVLFQYVPLSLFALGVLSALVQCVLRRQFWPAASLMPPAWRVLWLVLAMVVFERLGSKHWKSIIKEQIVLVKQKSDVIKKLFPVNPNA